MTEGWKSIKGVNWYTILGGHYIEKLGGKAAIRARPDRRGVQLLRLRGRRPRDPRDEAPELGPSCGRLPPLYVAVNDVIRPVRTTDIRSFGLGSNAGELRFNIRLTDQRQRRFRRTGHLAAGRRIAR